MGEISCQDIAPEVELVCECEDGVDTVSFIYNGAEGGYINCDYMPGPNPSFGPLSTGETLLLDPVANVRLACVNGMPYLTKVAGQDWIIQHVLPHHVRLYNMAQSTYLVRITILKAHIETAVSVKSGNLWNDSVLQILRGLTDKVANVRMVSATGLARIVEEGDPAIVQAQIVPALEKRNQEEEDDDCRNVYQAALSRAGK